MIIKGTVFHNQKFVFKDGEIGNKLLILLNTPARNDPYLLVKTTSNENDKSKTPGCDEKKSLLFIPTNTDFFELDTWVQFYDVYPFPPEDIQNNQDFRIIGTLDEPITSRIIDCLYRSNEDGIPEMYDNLIRPSLVKSLQQLQEKYRK